MCPNHIEHYLDRHVLKSCRLTQRKKLWNQYSPLAVDCNQIKQDFINKISQSSAQTEPHKSIQRIRIPKEIKSTYAQPILDQDKRISSHDLLAAHESFNSCNEDEQESVSFVAFKYFISFKFKFKILN